MKIIVIYENKDKVLPVIKAGKKIFSDFLAIPIEDMSIEAFREPRLFSSGKRLRFIDSIIPFPSQNQKDIFHAITHSFEGKTYMPYSHDAFMLFNRPALSLSFLRNAGYETVGYKNSLSIPKKSSPLQKHRL